MSAFHGFEATDHRFDAATNQLILLQKASPFGNLRVLPRLQGTVFFLQLVAHAHDIVHARFQAFQFLLEDVVVSGHAANIES